MYLMYTPIYIYTKFKKQLEQLTQFYISNYGIYI